tara:strand:- start:3616 stop:3906 length:291 start_codon:yes stop_codon:yes gene_type:complete
MISPEKLEQIIAEDIAKMNANAARFAEEMGPVPTTEDDMIVIRSERDRRIAETDWTQLPDVPEATRTMWQTYRQALRDVPQNYTIVSDVVWPTKPS